MNLLYVAAGLAVAAVGAFALGSVPLALLLGAAAVGAVFVHRPEASEECKQFVVVRGQPPVRVGT